jgi:hypothetical protein
MSDLGAARAHFAESLVLKQELGNRDGILHDLEKLAAVATAQGQLEHAARLFGAADGQRETLEAPLPASERAEHARSLAALRAAMGEEAFSMATAAARAMSLEAAVRHALEEA